MQRSYAVKLEANPGKEARMDDVLAEYQRIVNEKIALYWTFDKTMLRTPYPPANTRRGSQFVSLAARRAWGIVKSAQKHKGCRPIFRRQSIALEPINCRINLAPTSTRFDGWVIVPTLTRMARIALPFRKYALLKYAEETGAVAKSLTLVRRSRGWFAIFSFKMEPVAYRATQQVGVDVGYTVAAATSTGKMYGPDLDALQRRTKWRAYRANGRKPYRQGLNRVAREIVADHPDADFAVEKLHFTGKRKRSKTFRTRLSRFAYQHLAKRLEEHGQTEGFRVSYVNPAYTSQTCPECGLVDSSNRNGDRFVCVGCGHEAHADVNGAVNINGGEAVVCYGGPASPGPSAYAPQEYPGSVGVLAAKAGVT
jgi:putative transposase